MNKLKKIAYAGTSALLALPAVAGAQFQAPAGTGLPQSNNGLVGIATSIMNWLLIIVGILGVVGFVIAGVIYLTAAGDEDQIERGKKTMINSIIGVVVALLGLIVIKAVQSMLGGSSSSF